MAEEEAQAPPFDPKHPERFIPVQIGSKYYNTFEELKNEFGAFYLTPDLLSVIPKLPYYFAQGNPDIINGIKHTKIENERDRAQIKKMLEARIETLLDDGQLLRNNSLVANRKWKLVRELQIIIKNLGKDDGNKKAPDAKFVTSDELMSLFLDTLVKVSVSKKSIQVPDNWENIRETIQSLPPAEALLNSKQVELGLMKPKIKGLAKSNAFREFFLKGPTASTEGEPMLKGSRQFKQQIIKLLTFFSVNKLLGLDDIKSVLGTNATDDVVDAYFSKIQSQIPGILENIQLSYSSIEKFNRQYYLRTVMALENFIKTKAPAYPLDSMIQLNFMMFERERLVNKSNPIENDALPNNSGIVKIKMADTREIIELIKTYRVFMSGREVGTEDLSNELSADTPYDSLNRELIDMHKRPGKGPKLIRGILQLIEGSNIIYNETAMKTYIETLGASNPSLKIKLSTLQGHIDSFFRDAKDNVYILFQAAPETLFTDKKVKIKQLNDLQLFMATADMAEMQVVPPKMSSSAPIFKGIETETCMELSRLPKVKEEGKEDISPNLCKKFGITVNTELPLVYSITEMTGNILNIVAINQKIKKTMKITKQKVRIVSPTPITNAGKVAAVEGKAAKLEKKAAKLRTKSDSAGPILAWSSSKLAEAKGI